MDRDFSIFPIFSVGVATNALHASPPRIGELGTKKFVFGNLHKNAETVKQKKRKIFVLMSCEGSENFKQERISNFDFSKISPALRARPPTPPKRRVPSLEKGYGCSCRLFSVPIKQKNESENFWGNFLMKTETGLRNPRGRPPTGWRLKRAKFNLKFANIDAKLATDHFRSDILCL